MRDMRFFVLGALALLACRSPQSRDAASAVLVGRAADALALDPAIVTDAESAEVTEQIFDHLVRYRARSTEIEPSLATKWFVSEDGRSWTFSLRRGVRFHDGTTMDADAVVFSFERQRDPNHPFHRPDFIYWETTFRNIQSVERVDAYTVRINIERPYAPFLANLAMFPVSIVSPTAVKKWGAAFRDHPVGTGPFRFEGWTRGERITLSANRTYWDGAPQFEHLVFVAIRDARQRLVALEGGSLDVAENLAPQDLQFVALHPELHLHRIPGNNVAYLAMNVTHKPFDDVRVRQAVNHAINKTAIVKMIYQGLAEPATTPVPPSIWGHVDEPLYDFSPEKARRLLREAHYLPPREKPRLYVMDTPRQYLPEPETVARIIQHNLLDVGIDVDVISSSMDAHLRLTQEGQHDLCLLGWSADNGDPDNILYVLFDPENAEPGNARNLAFYKNAELHGRLLWARETTDRKDREASYRRVQDIIAEDAPWVPLAHAQVVAASRNTVDGLEVHPSSNIYFHRVVRR